MGDQIDFSTNSNLYSKFLNSLIKRGNKVKAKKLLDEALVIVVEKLNCEHSFPLIEYFDILNCFVEVRKVRVKRRFLLVPFPIKEKRRIFLIIKWTLEIVKKEKSKVSLSNKLASSISNVLEKSPSKIKDRRQLNLSQAATNKSNTHFRWK